MKNSEKYDEKQIYDRGKCFQVSLFVAIVCVFVSFFVTEVLGIAISSYIIFSFCMCIPMTVCIVLFILKDAFDNDKDNTAKFFLLIWCLFEFLIAVLNLSHIMFGDESLMKKDEISMIIVYMIPAICLIVIAVAYFIKKYLNKRSFDEED